MIVAAAGIFAALLALNVTNHAYYATSAAGVLYHFALPAAAVVGLLACLRLGPDGRLVAALCLVSVVPALYAAELYLAMRSKAAPVAEAATVDFDRRSKLGVILDLRRDGVDAYPAMRAKSMLVEGPDGRMVSAIRDGGDEVLPLASLPKKRIVACNETGRWMTYVSDDYGFHNPPDAWRPGRPEIALVGDSFAHGSCLASDKNIAANLGRRFGRVLNLGVSGFGPLAELAAIKEYLAAMKPKVVFWVYFEGNDLIEDMLAERRSAVLMSYLDDGFSQRLMARRDEIAGRFKAYLDARLTEAMGRVDDPDEALRDFLQLYFLRENFGLDPMGLGVIPKVSDPEYGLFRRILAEARRTVDAWGGRLAFVFLPDAPRYWAASRDNRVRDHIRRRVIEIADGLGLPVIDVHAAIVAAPDPQALYVFPGSHFNEAGYALAAETIGDWLRAQTWYSRAP